MLWEAAEGGSREHPAVVEEEEEGNWGNRVRLCPWIERGRTCNGEGKGSEGFTTQPTVGWKFACIKEDLKICLSLPYEHTPYVSPGPKTTRNGRQTLWNKRDTRDDRDRPCHVAKTAKWRLVFNSAEHVVAFPRFFNFISPFCDGELKG